MMPLVESGDEPRTLIDQLLADQQWLSAVELFSQAHDDGTLSTPRFHHLIPSAAVPGAQFAFEVHLDKCSGCKACVTACHALNGLDPGEAWREVELLINQDPLRPIRQFITTACHHCVEPGCLKGCPVLAYEKDPLNGIVRHLDDQCIGCQYCVMMCPYDVPKYSASRGIVRKCDMCSQRLAAGEAPACAQACPNEAIRITHVQPEAVRAWFRPADALPATVPAVDAPRRNRFLIASPDPAITLPTTRYVGNQSLPADLALPNPARTRLQPAHWPLVWMTVLTQSSVGAFALLPGLPRASQFRLAMLAWLAGIAGIACSVLHLGQPLKAWRSFLGLRHSWLSREIVAFGIFQLLASATVLFLERPAGFPGWISTALPPATVLAGIFGIFASAKIYQATGRSYWRAAGTFPKFFGTTVVLGLASANWLAALQHRVVSPIGALLAAAMLLKIAVEHRLLRGSSLAYVRHPSRQWSGETARAAADLFVHNSAWEELGLVTRIRFLCAIMGGVVLPCLSLLPNLTGPGIAGAIFLLSFAGEIAERYLFFRLVVPLKARVSQ